MTDNDITTDTTEVVDTPPTAEATEVDTAETAATEGTTEETEVPDEPESQSKREARYRVQLRETEAERDQLAARVETLQRAEVERLAAKVIQKPTALWAAQTPLADLLGDDGTVDPRKVTDAANAAQQALGLESSRSGIKGPYVPREGTSIHKSSSDNPWSDAFKG